MTQNEFIAAFAEVTGESKARSWDLLKKLSTLITETIHNWNSVKIVNLWSFSTVGVKSRNWVNPRTQEKIVISAFTKARFKPSSVLKRIVK